MIKKLVLILLTIGLFFSSFGTREVYATEKQKVKVGIFPVEGYFDIDENGNLSGYGIDYLNTMVRYTNWELEYVVGTFEECEENIQNGTIDLVGYALRTDESKKVLGFPNIRTGFNVTKLIVALDNENVVSGDYNTYEGLNIGVATMDSSELFLDGFASYYQFNFNKVTFETTEQLFEALEKGEVDAAFTGVIKIPNDTRIISSYSLEPFYVATSINNNRLLDELNYAISKVELNHPDLTLSLREKYYSESSFDKLELTSAEQEFIKNSNTIKVGYEATLLPIEGNDERSGEAAGYTINLLDKITQLTRLSFEYVETASYTEGESLLSNKTIDIQSSVNANIINQDKYLVSDAYISASVVLVAKDGLDFSVNDEIKVAITPNTSRLELMIRKLYPNCTFVYYESINDSYEDVEKGTIDMLVHNIYSAESNILINYNSLRIIYDLGVKCSYRFAFAQETPPELKSIINKCIRLINDSEAKEMMMQAMVSQIENEINYVTILMAVFAGSVLTLTTIYLYTRYQKSRNALTRMAYFDKMTDVYNRGAAEKLMIELINKSTQYSFIMLDIDNLKTINDNYGHLEGDKMIQSMAAIIKDHFRDTDIVARFGGDEFAIMVPNLNKVKVLEASLKGLMSKITATTIIDDHQLSASVGAVVCDNNLDFNTAYVKADEALYQSKNNGKNIFTIYKWDDE